MTSKAGGDSDSLARAVGAVVEGLRFYDLANAVVAEVRVKNAFEEFGRRKRAQLAKLESVVGSDAKEAAPPVGIYPTDAVSKVECYVCGFTIDAKSMPNQCPNCGAARYAFEKEISLAKAWEIAAETARKSAALFREDASRASGAAKAILEELADEEEGQVARANRQLAELRP